MSLHYNAPLAAANLLFIDRHHLTGPGHYAVQVFEGLSEMAGAGKLAFKLTGYVQTDARHHFSKRANTYLNDVRAAKGRIDRVIYEQLVLPFLTRRDKVDLLWSPAFVSPMWGAKALIATICDMYYEVLPEAVEPRQRIYWRKMIPLTARVCDELITISENSKADMLRFLPVKPERVHVTPLASRLRLNSFPPSAPIIEGDYLLLVANTTPNKNCERVVEAICQLRQQGSALKLVHVGNDINDGLRAAAEQVAAGDQLITLGKVDDETLANVYRNCRAAIVVSLYEGFGMPAAEALAMGAPLICSNVSALPEAAGGLDSGAALFVDPTNVGDITEAILCLTSDDEARQSCAVRGLEVASQMTWEKTASLTAATFDKALGIDQ